MLRRHECCCEGCSDESDTKRRPSYDLLWVAFAILFVIAVALGIYLFMVLNHLSHLLKRLRELSDKYSSHIEKTIDRLPSIAANIDETAENMKQGIEKAAATVDTVGTPLLKRLPL